MSVLFEGISPGSWWKSRGNSAFEVILLSNHLDGDTHPAMISCRGERGNVLSHLAIDWHRSFRAVPAYRPSNDYLNRVAASAICAVNEFGSHTPTELATAQRIAMAVIAIYGEVGDTDFARNLPNDNPTVQAALAALRMSRK